MAEQYHRFGAPAPRAAPVCTCAGSDFWMAIDACPRCGINQSVIPPGDVAVVASSSIEPPRSVLNGATLENACGSAIPRAAAATHPAGVPLSFFVGGDRAHP